MVIPPSEPFTAVGFVIDVVPLLRWPGNQCLVNVEEQPEALATTTATVTRLSGNLVAEAMSDGLSVGGELSVEWQGDCRRCLDPAVGTTSVELHEIYEREPAEGETYKLTDDRVDLEPMVREQVLLALPLAPLCRQGCEGPSPATFPAHAAADVDAEATSRDPRWDALDSLTFDD